MEHKGRKLDFFSFKLFGYYLAMYIFTVKIAVYKLKVGRVPSYLLIVIATGHLPVERTSEFSEGTSNVRLSM